MLTKSWWQPQNIRCDGFNLTNMIPIHRNIIPYQKPIVYTKVKIYVFIKSILIGLKTKIFYCTLFILYIHFYHCINFASFDEFYSWILDMFRQYGMFVFVSFVCVFVLDGGGGCCCLLICRIVLFWFFLSFYRKFL